MTSTIDREYCYIMPQEEIADDHNNWLAKTIVCTSIKYWLAS
jgi:hypothetical protein